MDEDLGVGLGGEPVAGREELLAELAVVVDLSVLDDPHRRVLVGHRLVAALDVDDRQPPHAESYAVEMDASFIVRSAVDHRPAHSLDKLTPACGVSAGDAADSAHLVAGHPLRRAGLPLGVGCRGGAFWVTSRTTEGGVARDSRYVRVGNSAPTPTPMKSTPRLSNTTDTKE